MAEQVTFTFQRENRECLETYEWDNIWFEHAPDQKKPRVLYIGDSISCGIRQILTRLSGETIWFDGFGTSRGVDNPYFVEAVALFARQQVHREAVLINNGLHGFHLDAAQYGRHYEALVREFRQLFPHTPMAIVLTTDVHHDPVEKDGVQPRNEEAIRIARMFDLPVIDLFSLSKTMEDQYTDGVHFTEEGYEKLAEPILAWVKTVLDRNEQVL